jgi:hypothetical protein
MDKIIFLTNLITDKNYYTSLLGATLTFYPQQGTKAMNIYLNRILQNMGVNGLKGVDGSGLINLPTSTEENVTYIETSASLDT